MNKFDKASVLCEWPQLPQNWHGMTGQEKHRYYTQFWARPEGILFETEDVEAKYRTRAKRALDAIALREPDEVPVALMTIGYILEYGNIQPKDAFYNAGKFISTAIKMHETFDLDYSVLTDMYSGPMLDTLGIRLIRWPGSSLPDNALPDDVFYQYVEDEYMREDEYDELIGNPEGYILRKYLPRICPSLAGFETLPNIFNLVELTGFSSTLSAFGSGQPARKALETLLQAADHALETRQAIIKASFKLIGKFGVPSMAGGITFAPYDIIGDTLRCTMGIMKDLYRRPEKVLAAVEALIPMAIQIGAQMAEVSRNPFILIPLHKGSDSFLSPEQFKTFYWPSLKATMTGLIDAGCVPIPFLEGSYDKRLDILSEDPLPKGRSMWIFNQVDMKAAKDKIGSWGCIAGNVPASLFKQGTPQMLEAYCKALFETCADGGGFFLFPGTIIDRANPANIQAYVNCGKKFGRYSSVPRLK